MFIENDSLDFNPKELHLYIIVLGARLKNTNIEIHDIKWVVGKNIKDTFKRLKVESYKNLTGLHIDSYLELKYIDGYQLELVNNLLNNKNIEFIDRYIWFVNLGGYKKDNLMEQHDFTFVIAKTKKTAIKLAKSKLLNQTDQKHKDNVYRVDNLKYYNNYTGKRSKVVNLRILLKEDIKKRSQDLIPKWTGYMPILIN